MKPITARHPLIVACAAAALVMSVALAACSAGHAAAASTDAAGPIPVTVATVTMTDVTSAIDSGGVVQARTTATITARILAPVRDVRVLPGDRVRKGQTLIVLDGDDLAAGARAARAAALAAEQGSQAAAAELQAAQAGLDLARASHDRISDLHAKRSATAQELDEATATLRSADARVAGASARALQAASAVESARAARDQAGTIESFTTIAAPFDGMVTEKMIEPGNTASPGMPLLRLEDTRAFRLEVRVDESRIAEIRNGGRRSGRALQPELRPPAGACTAGRPRRGPLVHLPQPVSEHRGSGCRGPLRSRRGIADHHDVRPAGSCSGRRTGSGHRRDRIWRDRSAAWPSLSPVSSECRRNDCGREDGSADCPEPEGD